MKTRCSILLTALGLTACATPPAERARALVVDAEATVREVAAENPELAAAIVKSPGVLIVPQLRRVSAAFSLLEGDCMMLARHDDGTFGPPGFCWLSGVGFGLQLGAEQASAVMVFTNRRAWELALTGPIDLGTQVRVAQAGSEAEGTAEAAAERRSADLLAFTARDGARVGVALEGAILEPEDTLNAGYHGETTRIRDAVFGESDGALTLRESLRRLTTHDDD